MSVNHKGKRRPPILVNSVTGACTFALGFGISVATSASGKTSNTARPTPPAATVTEIHPAVTVVATETVTVTISPNATGSPGYGDGLFVVDRDIPVGTYTTKGANPAQGNTLCRWWRYNNDPVSPVIASGSASGPITITLLKSDDSVRFSGCLPFTKTK